MNWENTSLSQLLLLVSEDNASAFQELYNRHKEFIFMMVYKRVSDSEDAKDISQEIFEYLWKFRKQLSQLEDFNIWLTAVVRNKIISRYRKQGIKLRGEDILLSKIEQLSWNAEDLLIAKELNQKIHLILNNLPETTKRCYTLSKDEGKKNQEIAIILKISEKTVRNNISIALNEIRLHLREKYPEFFLLFLILFHFF
ncbi:RNA polymerase sigma-70 factor, ECF subfamily [bacterium A37T11]|nr:RNA polymerase sigma-70 factor, ECF subfamily [bacterium A37T11]